MEAEKNVEVIKCKRLSLYLWDTLICEALSYPLCHSIRTTALVRPELTGHRCFTNAAERKTDPTGPATGTRPHNYLPCRWHLHLSNSQDSLAFPLVFVRAPNFQNANDLAVIKSVLPEYIISISICCIQAGTCHLCRYGNHVDQWASREWKLISVLHSNDCPAAHEGLHSHLRDRKQRSLVRGPSEALHRMGGEWFESQVLPWAWTSLPAGRLGWGLDKNIIHSSRWDWLRETAQGQGDRVFYLKGTEINFHISDHKRMDWV